MKPLKRREKLLEKISNVTNLLLDDIIIPNEREQKGSKTMKVGWYDEIGNRFELEVKLDVNPTVEPDETAAEIIEQLEELNDEP